MAYRMILAAAVLLISTGGLWMWRWANTRQQTPPSAPVPPSSRLVEFDRFSARHERSPEGERLTVSLRLRSSAERLPVYVFALVRGEDGEPRHWAIWPPAAAGRAITATGHFHGADPASGYAMTLGERWQRLSASYPLSGEGYDSIVIYVLADDGRILLARPFRL